MTDASHADDGGVEFIEETQSESARLRSALQTDGVYLSNLGAWSDLSMEVPNDETRARIISFVECTLVELTHEPLGAVYRSNEEWGVIETITVHADWTSITTDGPFVRFRRDPRTGTQVSSYSHEATHDALVARLSREDTENTSVSHSSFDVYPLSTLSRMP